MPNRNPWLLAWILLVLTVSSGGQLAGQSPIVLNNIIANPGFEEIKGQPDGWFLNGQDFSRTVKYWESPTDASPDLYHQKVKMPAFWGGHGFGNKRPHSGKGMVGITTFGCENGKPHCREYLQTKLVEPLVLNQQYRIEFWITQQTRATSCNNLGVYFSDSPLRASGSELLRFKPDMLIKDVISARDKWIKVSGTFFADNRAQYLVLGNFSPDDSTNTRKQLSTDYNFCYYYLDDLVLKKIDPILPVELPEDDLTRVELAPGKTIELNNIFFETGKAELLPESLVELHRLWFIMNANPGMVIEIIGHTDSQGSDKSNQELSVKRARAVVNYLNERKINLSRLPFKAFGESMPVSNNAVPEGRRLNRRVEFRIIKM